MADQHLKILQDAYKKAQAAVKKEPTGQNIKAVTTAKKALEDYQTELAAAINPEERRFANVLEVLGYLAGEGWKVSKSKLYEDRNKITKEKDGTYSKKAVDEYAKLVGLERLDGSGQATAEGVKKERLENDIREEKLKAIQRKNEIEAGLYVLRSEVEQKHTAKLALLLTATDNFFQGGKINEAVELIEGNKEKVAELRAFFKKEFRAMLGEYAKRPEFTVPKQAMTDAEELIKEIEGE